MTEEIPQSPSLHAANVDDLRGRYLKIGPPGTGKTTWLGKQVTSIVDRFWSTDLQKELHPAPVMVCSLTKTAAAEVAGRKLPIPRKCVGTLHSHCYHAIGKPKMAAGDEIQKFNVAYPHFSLSGDDPDVDDLCWDRREGTTPGAGDPLAEQYHLARARMLPRSVWRADVVRFAEAWEQWKAEAGLFDFTDLIEHCHTSVAKPPLEPKVLLADECQDMSALEWSLLCKWGEAVGCLIAVGDPWQSLYTWRGAHPELFNDKTVGPERRSVLRQSYRVPAAALRVAMKWAKRLSDHTEQEYHARKLEGVTVEGSVGICDATYKTPTAAITLARRYLDAGLSVMMLGTCSFMLNPVCAELKKIGLPFSNPWRRRRGDWNPLHASRGSSMADRICAFLQPLISVWGDDAKMWTWKDFEAWGEILRAEGTFLRGGKTRMYELAAEHGDEQVDWSIVEGEILGMFEAAALLNMMSAANVEGPEGQRALGDLMGWYRSRVAASSAQRAEYPLLVRREFGPKALRDEPRLFVGTVHSFKGAEADVVIVFPDISPAAFQGFARGGALADPVVRTMYVGVTRTKQHLVFCRPASDLAVPLDRLMGA